MQSEMIFMGAPLRRTPSNDDCKQKNQPVILSEAEISPSEERGEIARL